MRLSILDLDGLTALQKIGLLEQLGTSNSHETAQIVAIVTECVMGSLTMKIAPMISVDSVGLL